MKKESDQESNNSNPSIVGISFRNWHWVLIFSVLVFIAGIFILVKPEILYRTLSYFIGIGLILLGCYKVFSHNSNSHSHFLGALSKKSFFDIFFGCLYVVIGIVLFIYSEFFMVTVPFFIGALVLFYAFFIFAVVRYLSGNKLKRGLWISGFIALGIAVSAFVYPSFWGDILGRGAGVFLIFLGAVGVVFSLYLKKAEWEIPVNF